MPYLEQILFRRGTAAQWAAANPVLALGEPGEETDTNVLKIGDGVTAWASLPASNNGTYVHWTGSQLTQSGVPIDLGAASVPDADAATKGKVQLAGDLAGTAASPAVAKVNGVAVTGTPITGQVPTATSGTAATWQTPSGGGAVSSVVGQTGAVTGAQLVADTTVAGALATKAATTTTITAGTGLTGGGDLSANRSLAVSYGTTTGTAAQGNDSRITGALSSATAATTYASLLVTTTSQAGTTYTLALADAGTVVELSSATPVTVTVPPNSGAAFPVGTSIVLRQYGAGQVTVAQGAGVTIRSRGAALKMAGQYAEATVTQRATDEWVLSGDVTT